MAEQISEHQKVLLRLRTDPLFFVTAILQAQPEHWQADVLTAIVTDDRIAIRSGHGVGKTTLLAWIILWWLLRTPCKVAVTANTASQLFDSLWSEIASWHRRMPTWLKDEYTILSDRVVLTAAPDMAFAVARTARKENPEALQGFHSENMLFVIDEASGVDDVIFEVAEGAMSTPGAKAIMTGNPNRSTGYFFDAFNKMRHRWRTFRVGCMDSTRVSPNYIEDMKTKYGEDSNIYRVRVLGEFPYSEDDKVIPLELVEAAINREVENTGGPIVWGLDVARFGNDRSALAKRQGNTLLEPIRTWSGKDTMQTAALVFNQYANAPQDERPTEILVDVIGIGSGVVDRLRQYGLPVRGVNVAETASDSELYQRKRDELWFKAKDWFSARDCRLPAGSDDLVAELVEPKYHYSTAGKLQVESKDDMKRRGVRSPDIADAFCLTFDSKVNLFGGKYAWNRPIEYDYAWVT